MGRPPGSRNKNPQNTSKIEGKESELPEGEAVAEADRKFTEGLSGDMKELYKGFSVTHKLPLDDLRLLAKSMKARYNMGLQSEIKAHENVIRNAKEECKTITETKTIRGTYATPERIKNRLIKLELIINRKYYINAQLTTLSTELRNVFVEIERIEAGQPKGNVNIFNLLAGKGDKVKVDALEEELFTPDEELSNQLRRDAEKNDN